MEFGKLDKFLNFVLFFERYWLVVKRRRLISVERRDARVHTKEK